MADHGGFDLLKLVGRRVELLERLADEPHDKRDLEAELELSRSTVDRAVRDLEPAGLVTRTAEGYRTTLAGRLLAELYREFLRRSTEVVDAVALLGALPPDSPVDPALLDGCEVVHVRDLSAYETPPVIAEVVDAADHVVGIVTASTEPEALKGVRDRIVAGDVTAELFLAPGLLATLREQFPAVASGFAAGDSRVYEADVPGFGMLHAPERAELTVGVAETNRSPLGILYNDTPEASRWAESLVEDLRADATDVTAQLQALARSTGEGRLLAGSYATLETEGFVELSAAYFDRREPAPLSTSWRTGLDLTEVRAGQAVDREYVPDDDQRGETPQVAEPRVRGGDQVREREAVERRSVAEDVLDRLRAGRDVAVVGPPGSGRSTICKTVACRWYDRTHGPVLYRSSGTGEPFESWATLVDAVRTADGHALVVVEDALRPEASAVFRAMTELRGDGEATFLVDAREDEWNDPPEFPVDAELEAYRAEAVETVAVPPLDEREVERFVERFEAATGHEVGPGPADLLAELRAAGQEGETADRAAPGELQLLLHRLSLRVAPLTVDDSRTPTTLVEDVRRVYRELERAGEGVLDVGVLANLLNAAGMALRPVYVQALGVDHGPEAVEEALSILSGRVIFEDGGTERTVHRSWSTVFLRELLEEAPERAAAERFGRVVTALLALADDPDRRAAVADAVDCETPHLERIAEAPTEWTKELFEAIFAVGREHPGLAPLYGTTDREKIRPPDVCDDEQCLEVLRRRGTTYLRGGYLDRAATEFEALREQAGELAPDCGDEYRARAHAELATVAYRQGDLDCAERRCREALEAFRALDDRAGVAEVRKKLGNVAYLRGEMGAAEGRYREALAAYRELGDRLEEAYTLHNLGNVADVRGEMDVAEGRYREALAVYRELGDRRDEADCLNNLGVVAESRGDFDVALDYYRESLERYRDIGDRQGEANGLYNLGEVHVRRGDPDRAEEHARRALRRYRDIGDSRGEADAVRTLGTVARQRSDHEEAARRCEQALETYRDIGDGRGEAKTQAELGRIALDRGDLDRAERLAREALAACRENDMAYTEAASRRLLGVVARRRRDLDAATEHLAESRATSRDASDRFSEARALVELGELALVREDPSAACSHLREATTLFWEGDAPGRTVDALVRLATACREEGDCGAAGDALQRARRLATDADLDARAGQVARRLDELDGEGAA